MSWPALQLQLVDEGADALLATLRPRLWILPSNEQVEVLPVGAAGWIVAAARPSWALGRPRSTQEREPMAREQAEVWLRVARIAALEDLEVRLAAGVRLCFRRQPECPQWVWRVTAEPSEAECGA